MSKIKLSPKQKEVIKHMRRPVGMFKNITYVILIMGNGCSIATFRYLLKNKIIKPKGGRTVLGWEYVLTELGKTIEL